MVKEYVTRSTWSHVDILMAGLAVIIVLWANTPSYFPASQFIDLHLVEVEDGYIDQPIPLEAENTIHMATENAFYEVDVIDADTGIRACFARRTVPYGSSETVVLGVRRLIEKTLRWWAYSDDGECQRWQPWPGEFYVKTRHCWNRYWWSRTACSDWLDSNVFTLKASRVDM